MIGYKISNLVGLESQLPNGMIDDYLIHLETHGMMQKGLKVWTISAQAGHQNLHLDGKKMIKKDHPKKKIYKHEKPAFLLSIEINISNDLLKIAHQMTATRLQKKRRLNNDVRVQSDVGVRNNIGLLNEASPRQAHHVKEVHVLKKGLIGDLLPLLAAEVLRLSDGEVRRVVLARLNEPRRLGNDKAMLRENLEIKIDLEHRQYQSQKRISQARL